MNYGRYQITKEVGRGSMGVVYEAHDPQIDRMVAVKVLRQDRLGTEAFVNRFLKEARVIGRLSHPNIVAIYDVGEEQGTVYIAMEFLTGTSLADIVKGDPVDADHLVAYGEQIAEALDYAHGKGVIHRDIKPGNIVVHEDGGIKLTDFGIAHIDDASATMQTQAGEILGTPAYMSPEQVLGKPVDGRSDLFSLGAILYELCTGRRAFGGSEQSLATVFNEIINGNPEAPTIVAPAFPGKLSAVIIKSMEKEPINRFQTGKEFAAALRDALTATTPSGPVAAETAKKKNRLFPAIAITGVVTVILIAVYFPRSTPPASPVMPQKTERPAPLTKQTLPEAAAPAAESPLQKPLEQPQPAKVPPVAELVTLKVKTIPPGATVSVDGSSKGTTPLTLRLAKGTHLLRMTRTGYRALDKQITIEETMEYPLTFDLNKAGKPD